MGIDPKWAHPPLARHRISMLVGLHHSTRYTYDRPVSLGPQVVRLRPGPHCRTRIVSYAFNVKPAGQFVNWQQDPFGNWLARCVVAERTREFSVEVDLVADITAINPFGFFVEPYAETWPFEFPPDLGEDVAPFLKPQPAGAHTRELLRSIPRHPQNTVDFLVLLNRRLHHLIRYVTRLEDGVQTTDETLASGTGSCRDMAWLLAQILRHIGLPARFVSGYLVELRPDAAPSESGADHDRAELHAWAEVYLPGAGWIGLDATSGLLCAEGHLPLAATPHYRSAAAITGTVEPCNTTFSYQMSVARIAEGPPAITPISSGASLP